MKGPILDPIHLQVAAALVVRSGSLGNNWLGNSLKMSRRADGHPLTDLCLGCTELYCLLYLEPRALTANGFPLDLLQGSLWMSSFRKLQSAPMFCAQEIKYSK